MRKILAVLISVGFVVGLAAPAAAVLPFITPHNGDANGSGVVDMTDAIYLLNFLYSSGPAPVPLDCEPFVTYHNGDVNGDEIINLTDAIHILNWEFRGGPAPVAGCPED